MPRLFLMADEESEGFIFKELFGWSLLVLSSFLSFMIKLKGLKFVQQKNITHGNLGSFSMVASNKPFVVLNILLNLFVLILIYFLNPPCCWFLMCSLTYKKDVFVGILK